LTSKTDPWLRKAKDPLAKLVEIDERGVPRVLTSKKDKEDFVMRWLRERKWTWSGGGYGLTSTDK